MEDLSSSAYFGGLGAVFVRARLYFAVAPKAPAKVVTLGGLKRRALWWHCVTSQHVSKTCQSSDRRDRRNTDRHFARFSEETFFVAGLAGHFVLLRRQIRGFMSKTRGKTSIW